MEQSVAGQPSEGRPADDRRHPWGRRFLIASGLAVVSALAYVGWLTSREIAGRPAPTTSPRLTVAGEPSGPAAGNGGSILRDGRPSLGPATAPVTIVEFGDFECPFCRESFPVIRSLAAEYGDRLRLVYRHFPVPSIHEHAVAAAEAAACAASQGKFWEYHDRLFLNQERLDTASLQRYAEQAGLNLDDFRRCADARQPRALVEEDAADGRALGVRGTPTWFVNGRKVEGAVPEPIFRQIIEASLDR